MEGLPDQRPRPAQNHDARRGRVHPPLPPARAAERLPPHPPLRPVRQRRSSLQHRARPPIARRARGRARALARRAGQRGRNRFAGAPLPVLRRPDDHCRNLRRRAPRALAITDPDQDRHLMIVAALPAAQRRFSSPPAARRSRKPMSSRGRQSSSDRRARARPAHTRDQTRLPSSVPPPRFARHQPATNASRPDPKISIGRARPNGVPSYPRFPPWEAFERRPQNPYDRPANGRRPKPFTKADFSIRLLLQFGRRFDTFGSLDYSTMHGDCDLPTRRHAEASRPARARGRAMSSIKTISAAWTRRHGGFAVMPLSRIAPALHGRKRLERLEPLGATSAGRSAAGSSRRRTR